MGQEVYFSKCMDHGPWNIKRKSSFMTLFFVKDHWFDTKTHCWVESVQSTLSHLITASVPRAMITRFSWSMDYFITIYIEQTDLGVGFHNLMNDLKPFTFRITTFQWLLSMKSQLNVDG